MVARTLSVVLFLASLAVAQTYAPKRVLILLENDVSWPAYRLIDENARVTLREGMPGGVMIFSEHLDRAHFPDPKFQQEQIAWIRSKYADSKLDLMIAVGDVPTDMFPTVPLVYARTDPGPKSPNSLILRSDAASIWTELDAQKTVQLAHRLQPEARQVVVISGATQTGKNLLDQVSSQIGDNFNDLPVTYLTNLTLAEFCKKVAVLGRETILLFVSMGRDGDGRPYVSAEVIPKITAASGSPVYTLLDTHVGSGAVGGYVVSFAEVGKQAGEMGLQLLAGEHPKDEMARSDYLFDWRQLHRWKFSESILPVGSVILFRQPRFLGIFQILHSWRNSSVRSGNAIDFGFTVAAGKQEKV